MKNKILCIFVYMLLTFTVISTAESIDVSKESKKEEIVASGENDWPMYRHDASHTGYSDSNTPIFGFIKWTKKLGEGVTSSPAIVNGKLYVGSDSTLYCLNTILRGIKVWSKTLAGICTSPAVVNEKVYVCGGNIIYCFDANNGDEIWSKEKGEELWATNPIVCDSKVYVGSCFPHGDTEIWCLDAETGDLIWSFDTIDEYMPCSPAVSNGKVYIISGGVNHGTIWCLDANGNGDGTTDVIWNYITNSISYSSPSVYNGKVYCVDPSEYNDYEAMIYSLDAETGEKIWEYSNSDIDEITSSPAVADGKVYIGVTSMGGNGILYCLDTESGNLIWSYSVDGGDIAFSSPAVAGKKIFFGSHNGKIYCLNNQNGKKIWSRIIDFINPTCVSSPAIANGRIYVGSSNGRIYCFGRLLI